MPAGNASPGPISDDGYALLDAMADHNPPRHQPPMGRGCSQCTGPLSRPDWATHANPRAFVDSPRMLTDDLIRRIAEREGRSRSVVACNSMLEPGWHPGQPLPLMRMVEAIDHICQIVGHAEAAGIGSDLDGGFGLESIPAELSSAADLVLFEGLCANAGTVRRTYGESSAGTGCV